MILTFYIIMYIIYDIHIVHNYVHNLILTLHIIMYVIYDTLYIIMYIIYVHNL